MDGRKEKRRMGGRKDGRKTGCRGGMIEGLKEGWNKNRMMGQVFSAVVTSLLGPPVSDDRGPGFESWLHFRSSFMAICILGVSRCLDA